MMYLAIEIGGTKLQMGIGTGEGGPLSVLRRTTVEPTSGASGICRQITQLGAELIRECDVAAVGIGFGGPVDPSQGTVIKSHQIEGWEGFPLVSWAESSLGRPVCLGNDADMAGLGEALFGAGRDQRVVLYSNVGSGIGGALVLDGQLFLGGSGGAQEIGHLRPGLHADTAEHTVESLASGWGMTQAAIASLQGISGVKEADAVSDLLKRCGGDTNRLNTKMLADAMASGNRLAVDVFQQGICAYGWALAQAITLTGPNVVVVGGGVALVGEKLYLIPLRREIERYVFPPRLGTYHVKGAELGEEVVLHGALALAKNRARV